MERAPATPKRAPHRRGVVFVRCSSCGQPVDLADTIAAPRGGRRCPPHGLQRRR